MKKPKPFAIRKRYTTGPRGGLTWVYDVIDVRANLVLSRLPTHKIARRMRDSLNATQV